LIAELGHAALWLAAGMMLLQMAGSVTGRPGWSELTVPAAMAQAWFLTAALLALLWCFAITDLSVALVNDSSHSLKPLLQRLADIVRLDRGQLFVFAVIVAIAGGVSAFQGRSDLPAYGLASLVMTTAALVADPFARIETVPAQGRSFADGMPVTALCLAVLAFVLLIARSRVIRGGLAAALLVGGAVMAMDSVRRVETVATLAIGRTVDVGPVQVRLTALEPVAGPGHTAVRAHLIILRDGKAVSSIHPEHRAGIYPRTNASPRAVALIKANALSARVGETDTTSAVLTLVWHPLLS
jgi:cytochrome c biogenesis factor